MRIKCAFTVMTAAAMLLAAASPAFGESSKTVRYGPYTIPGGTMEAPGTVSNRLSFLVTRPCVDCYITSYTPNLVYGDGTTANLDSGPMLHHVVFASQFRSDATCSGTPLGLAGERFFASGNERTAIRFPAGYGYRVRWYDAWTMLADLMNHSATAKTVYVQVKYTYRAPWEDVKSVRPVWLDIDQCGDSEYSIPAGFSDTHRDWSVNVPGKAVAAIGHVHGHGVRVVASNESQQGAVLCESRATLDPNSVHNVLAMSTCTGDPIGELRAGDVVRLHSEYQSSHAADDVMGIMLLYVRPQ
jgi:hypothetical protein